MSDDNTPQHLKYVIEANLENARQIETLVRNLGKVAEGAKAAEDRIKGLQKATQALLGVNKPQQVRQVRSSLSSLGAGDYDTQLALAANRGSRQSISADPAVQTLKNEAALQQQMKNRITLIEREIRDTEKLITLARQLNSMRMDDPAFARTQADFLQAIDPLLVSSKTGRRLTGAPRNSKIASLTSRLAAGDTDDLVYNAYSSKYGGIDRQQFQQLLNIQRELTSAAKAERAEQERISAEKQKQLEFSKQMANQARVMSATDKAVRRRFMSEHGARLQGMSDDAAREAEFTRLMGSYGPQMSVFGQKAMREQMDEINRRAAVESARMQEKADAAWIRMRDQADNDNRRFDERRQAERDAPMKQARGAVARTEAYNGAGLFAIQGRLLGNYAAMGAGLGTMSFLGNYVVELETALKQLQAISTATNGEMKDLTDTVMGLATTSKFTAQELADAATTMAQAGLSAKQIGETIEAVSNLAVATGTDLATTVDIVTSAMTVFDLQTSEAARVANTLTAAMNLSKLTMDKFSLGLQYSGNIADTLGIKYTELAALMGGMSDAGIRSGSTLGTGLRQLLLDLQAPTDKAQAVFDRLGLSKEQLDIESQGIFRVLENLKEKGLSTADATEAFEVRAVAAFKALMNQLPHIKELNDQIMLTEAATAAAGTQMDTMGAQWNRFSQGAGALFYKTTGQVRDLIKWLLGGFADLAGALAPIMPLLQGLTTATLLFISVWAGLSFLKVIHGFIQLRAEMAAVRAEMMATMAASGRLGAAIVLLQRSLGVIGLVLAGVSVAMSLFGGNSESNTGKLEDLAEATNRAKGELDATKQTIESLDTAMANLVNRYDALSGNASDDLKREINELMIRFSQYGLTLDDTKDSIDDVIAATTKLRTELSSTQLLQAQIARAALEKEQRGVAGKLSTQLATGEFDSGTLKKDETLIASLLVLSKKYPNLKPDMEWLATGVGRGMSQDDLLNMDVNDLMRRQGRLSATMSDLRRQKLVAQGKNQSTAEIDQMLFAADNAMDWLAKIFAGVNEISNKGKEIENLDKGIKLGQAQSSSAFGSFQAVLQTAKGSMDGAISKTLDTIGKSPDRETEDLTELKLQWAKTVETLNTARNGLFEKWMDENIVGTRDEALKLFEQTTLFDDFTFIQQAFDQELAKRSPETRKRVGEAYAKAATASKATMTRLVAESRLPEKMDLPEGAVGILSNDTITGLPGAKAVARRSLEDTIQAYDEAFVAYTRAVRAEFENKSPNAFKKDDVSGKVLDTAGYAEWLAKQQEMEEAYFKGKADIYGNYGRTYDRAKDRERRKKDIDLEMLKQREDTLRKSMSTVAGSVDGQSAVNDIAAARDEYSRLGADLLDVVEQIKTIEWKRDFGEDARFGETLNEAIQLRLKEVQEEITKGVDDLINTEADSRGRDLSRKARYSRQNAESLLDGIADGDLANEEVRAARMDMAAALIEQIKKDFRTQFENDPQNANKLHLQETKDQLEEQLSEYMTARVKAVFDIAAASVEATNYSIGRKLASYDVELGMLDNPRNRGRAGSTQRWMLQRGREKEAIRLMPTGINALQRQESDLQSMLDGLMTERDVIGGGVGASQNAQAILATQRELLKVQRELTAATDEYTAATGRATDPKWNELLGASIDMWLESELAMRSWIDTLADELPGVFSSISGSIGQALGDIASHARDTGDALEDMGRQILRSMIDLALKMAADQLIQWAIQTITSLFMPGGNPDAPSPGYQQTPVTPIRRAAGGEVTGGIQGLDSVRLLATPGEVVMSKRAVDMIGKDRLLDMNRTGRMANSVVGVVAQQQRDPDMVNVYVVSPDQRPAIGPKDIVVAITDDIARGGSIKRVIKQVAMGQK